MLKLNDINIDKLSNRQKRTIEFRDKFLGTVAEYNSVKEPPNPPDRYSQFIEVERLKLIEKDKQNIVNTYISKFNSLSNDISGAIQMYDNKINELRFPKLKEQMYSVDEIQYETYKAIEFNSALMVANNVKTGDSKIFSVIENSWKSGKKHFASYLIDSLMLNLPENVKIEEHEMILTGEESITTNLQNYYNKLNSVRLYEFDSELNDLIVEKINLDYLLFQISILNDVLGKNGYTKYLISQFEDLSKLPDELVMAGNIKLIDTFNKYYTFRTKNLWSE